MAVPAKAYVCAYCKKRLRTSPLVLGCAGLFALFIIVTLFIGNATKERPAASPVAPRQPAPTLSAEELKEIKKQEREQNAEDDRFLKTKAGKVWAKHKDWDRELCQVIAERKIHIGMTAEQVRAAWGKPERVNSTEFPGSVHEQWVYGSGNYVYFENGVMTSLQQSK